VAGLTAQLSGQPVKIVDVSYGGVRFEIRSGEHQPPPESFELQFSEDLSLQADLVWTNVLAEDMRVCGAAVWPDEGSARQWFGLVDTAN
jgi:hypothetical protein